MLAKTEDLASAVTGWLARFERALGSRDDAALTALFVPDSHWRDLVSFTWHLTTSSGRNNVIAALKQFAPETGARDFRIGRHNTSPRNVTRIGTPAIEAIFAFETALGRCSGVVRLVTDPADNAIKAWTLMTALEEIKGHEERIGARRPTGQSHSRDFRGPNWLDQRTEAIKYDGRDPDVLVVGGGQAGLSIAARLGALGIDTLIVDRGERIGDNWRKRYHALTLHNQVQVNHFPYMPFPPNWPTYIPKDKIANWFETYVESLELNYWTSTEFLGGTYDERLDQWSVALRRRNGTVRELRPRHVVMATSATGIPNIPDIPSLKNYTGKLIHSSQYDDGENWNGKRAIVIGTGNSGHDIAQDLTSSGAQVTLVQRSSTMVVNIEPSAQLAYALYDEGPSTEDCDLLAASFPFKLVRKSHIMLTERGKELDKPLLDALAARGFKLDYGEDDSGWQFKFLARGGGYYFNVGCSDMIVDGKVKLAQFADISEFTASGAQMRNGTALPADLIVLATGYKGQQHLVSRVFGETVAARVGRVWGIGEHDELCNMFTRTPQPGLYFIAGSFAQCRIYSKYLALQIKAREVGMIAPVP